MPINLGISVNTIKDELYPYISDNKFYFSSNGKLGHGGFDIFSANIDKYYNVSDVSNLGYSINSTNDDYGYRVFGDRAFISSNRIGSIGLDIYEIIKL